MQRILTIFGVRMSTEFPSFKVRKKKLGSYPYLSVVLSVTLALFVIGVFGLLVIYSKELERVIRNSVNVQVFLKNNRTEAQRNQIEKNLLSRYFLARNSADKPVQFISKEAKADEMIRESNQDFRKLLGENPLHDAFIVKIDPAYHDSLSMAKIKTEIEQINGVFEATYEDRVLESINRNMTNIGLILLGLATVLLLTVVLLINSTLRLALFSQRFLIRSMQLVGARRRFIQGPFLVRATLHGLLAGILASGLLVGLISFAKKYMPELTLIQNTNRITVLLAGLLLLGIFVATASTYRAVSKYLKLSLDELY